MNSAKMKAVLWPVNVTRWKWGNVMFYNDRGSEKLGIVSAWTLCGRGNNRSHLEANLYSAVFIVVFILSFSSEVTKALVSPCGVYENMALVIVPTASSVEPVTYKEERQSPPKRGVNSSGWDRNEEAREQGEEKSWEVLSTTAQPLSVAWGC